MTSFIIEHQCPQCGAPAELDETDRLFRCGFCRTGSYLTVPDLFRYVMPHKAPTGKEVIYFPYWRFKGMLFSCFETTIENRFVDVSHQAISSMHFPFSVGFRSQTQKLRFAGTQAEGLFLEPQMTVADFRVSITERFNSGMAKPILHQAQIGETISLLYAPFYEDGRLYDAVLNEPLAIGNPADFQPVLEKKAQPNWPIQFIATLCPECGWDLNGDRDSLALTCGNCDTAWWVRKGALEKLKVAHVPETGDDVVYMPFWRIKADVSHIQLETYADLITIANLPKVVQSGWDQIPFYFWSPAFKVRPQNLLTFATNVTLSQPVEHTEQGQPKGRLQAVTMPLQEASETLKLMVADFMRPKGRRAELLPDLTVIAKSFLLVYLPFRESHLEYIHNGLNLAINKQILSHARNL